MNIPFETTEIIVAPMRAFRISPRPPKRLVPPMTAAAMASISSVPPPALVSTLFRRAARTMPAEPRHRARDHEDEDADASDVDPGSPRGLRVPPDRVDVPPERRPLGDERPHDEARHDEQERERHSAVLVQDRDRPERDHRHHRELGDPSDRIAQRDPVAALRDHAGEHPPTYATLTIAAMIQPARSPKK